MSEPRRLVIAGGGLAAWMTAACLAKRVSPRDYMIMLVGTNEPDRPFLDADATMPLPPDSRTRMLIDDDAVIAQTGSCFTYGIALGGWSSPEETFFHPYGMVGADLGPAGFHHIVGRLRRDGRSIRLADYSLSALAAQAGRFSRPSDDARDPRSSLDCGIHIDCPSVRDHLKANAIESGVVHMHADVHDVERDGDRITGVIASNGARITASLFIDCTGEAAKLCDNKWIEWSNWLGCDSSVALSAASSHPPLPYSHAAATRSGWIRHLPLAHRLALTCFYRSEWTSTDEAVQWLAQAAGQKVVDPHTFQLRPGRRQQPWRGNCIALGGAASVLDPVGVSDLHALMVSIDKLTVLLPEADAFEALAAEYNRQVTAWLDSARDFAILHYALNGRQREPFWTTRKHASVPDSLQYRLDFYQRCGRLVHYDEEALEDDSWIMVLDGLGVRPQQLAPVVDGFQVGHLESHVGRVRERIIDTLKMMPTLADYLASIGSEVQQPLVQGGSSD